MIFVAFLINMFEICGCECLKKHENQCFIVAAFTILTSTSLIVLSILYLLPNHEELHMLLTRLNMADNSAVILSSMTLLLCSLWMLSGILLVMGVIKNTSGLVLFYFVYGIFFMITLHVAALLMLLHKDWAFSSGIIFISVIHIRGLMSGYQTYDLMQRGKIFGVGENELLVEEEPEENV